MYVDRLQKELQIGTCVITTGNLETGFEFPSFKLAVFTELELYGRQKTKPRPTKVEEGLRLTPQEMRVGDYVVHITMVLIAQGSVLQVTMPGSYSCEDGSMYHRSDSPAQHMLG